MSERKKANTKARSYIGKNDEEFQILWENLPSVLINELSFAYLALIIDYAYEQMRRGEIKNS